MCLASSPPSSPSFPPHSTLHSFSQTPPFGSLCETQKRVSSSPISTWAAPHFPFHPPQCALCKIIGLANCLSTCFLGSFRCETCERSITQTFWGLVGGVDNTSTGFSGGIPSIMEEAKDGWLSERSANEVELLLLHISAIVSA